MKIELYKNIGDGKWIEHDVEAETIEEAAYKAVLSTHHFLSNYPEHTYLAGERTLNWGGKITKFNSIRFFKNKNDRDNYTKYYECWFAVKYRYSQFHGKVKG
jgi:hypothetical protein